MIGEWHPLLANLHCLCSSQQKKNLTNQMLPLTQLCLKLAETSCSLPIHRLQICCRSELQHEPRDHILPRQFSFLSAGRSLHSGYGWVAGLQGKPCLGAILEDVGKGCHLVW